MTEALPRWELRLASVAILAALVGLALWRGNSVLLILAGVGLAATLISFFPWNVTKLPARAIGGIFRLLGQAISQFLLFFVYLAVVIPISLILRNRVRKEFTLEGRRAGWIDGSQSARPTDFERMF